MRNFSSGQAVQARFSSGFVDHFIVSGTVDPSLDMHSQSWENMKQRDMHLPIPTKSSTSSFSAPKSSVCSQPPAVGLKQYPTNHGRLTSLVDGSLQSIGGSPGSPCFDLPNVGTETFLCEQVRFERLVGCRLDHGSSWRRFDLPHTTKSTTLTLRTLPKEAKKEGQSEWVRSEIHSTKIGLERLEVKHLKI